MNLLWSHRIHKNRLDAMDTRLRASLEARRGRGIFGIFLSLIRRGGVPSGAAAVIVPGGEL